MALGDDPTLDVLRDIYRAVQGTNSRLDETNKRIDETNKRIDESSSQLHSRIDETNAKLGSLTEEVQALRTQADEIARRQVDSEMRVSTELITVAKLLREKVDDQKHVVDHERRLAVLETKVG